MTREEAISELEYIWIYVVEFKDERTTKAFNIAIEDMEKQIPKMKHKYQGYRCICGEEVAKNQRYCEYCGQHLLDWEEVKK